MSSNLTIGKQKETGTPSNRIVGNGSFQQRLESFVIAFVKEFEARLFFYDLFHQGQKEYAKKLSPSRLQKVMGDVGKYSLASIGFVANLASASTPLSIPALATAGSMGVRSISAGKAGGEWVAEMIDSKLHDKKRKDYANKLWEFIQLYRDDRTHLREKLISAALDIFKSFEQQFMTANNNKKWRKGMIDLANDGVHRSVSYCVDHYEPTNVTYGAIISMGVIEGKSKDRPPYTKPELVYEDEKGQIKWYSSSLYGKTGIVIVDGEKYLCYEKNDESNKARKYGYRLLLQEENWSEIAKKYKLSPEKGIRFQNYNYKFRTLDEDERKLISNKIDSDNEILTKGGLKEVIEEVKHSILNEINGFLKLQSKETNSDDSEILQNIAINIKKINVQELEEKFLEHLNEIKRSLQEMSQNEKQHHQENIALHQKTHSTLQDINQKAEEAQVVLREIRDGKESESNQPIWFDIIEPINTFTRKSEFNSLKKIMERVPQKNIMKSLIWGLGGMGKTQLARQYIEEIGKNIYENIIWINSETETDINDSFIRLAKELKLKISEDEKDKMKIIINEVYKILNKRDTLLIFDNAEKTKMFMEILPKSVNSSNKKTHILVTSRNREWGRDFPGMHLQEMSLEDGMKLVKDGLEITNNSEDENIKRLLDTLQNFPLCLIQAVSYIRERQLSGQFTIKKYLNEFEKIPRDLFDSDAFKEFDNDPYAKTAYTAWIITMNIIREDKSIGCLAIRIFHIMAYLASRNIKRRLFRKMLAKDENLERATRLLAKYSMIDIVEANNGTAALVEGDKSAHDDENDEICLELHRTVQDVTRLHLKEDNAEDEVIEKTITVLNEYLILTHTTVINYDKVREGLPHIETFLTHLKYKGNENQERKHGRIYEILIGFLTTGYFHLGNPRKQKVLLEEAVTIYQKHYGPDHYEVARTLVNLGSAYGSLGDVQKQKELLEKALNIKEKHYGPDHYEVAITLTNLGSAYGSLGDVQKQKELLEKALNILEKHWSRLV